MPTPINYNAIKRSNGPISPAVITSKMAKDDLFNIQQKHSDAVTGMANQSMRLEQMNMQKQAELQNQNSMKMDMQKAELASSTEIQKQAMQSDLKREELSIKRAALSGV